MSQRVLFTTLGGAVALLIVAYGWMFFFSSHRRESPQTLAQQALSASDPRVQHVAAAKLAGLSAAPSSEYIPAAQVVPAVEVQQQIVHVLKESKEPAVRAAMIQSAANSYNYDSMPLILEALEDSNPVVFGRASAAADRMLGVKINFRQDDTPQERKRKIELAREAWRRLEKSDRLDRWKKRLAEMPQQER